MVFSLERSDLRVIVPTPTHADIARAEAAANQRSGSSTRTAVSFYPRMVGPISIINNHQQMNPQVNRLNEVYRITEGLSLAEKRNRLHSLSEPIRQEIYWHIYDLANRPTENN